MIYKGKVAVITGASGGIGATVARMLAERGAIPVLTARSKRRLNGVISTIKSEHGVFELDVGSTMQTFEVFGEIFDQYGRIDMLINNAGYGLFEPFVDATMEQIEDMMNVNFMGTVRCTKAVLPYMLQSGSGHIVNIASLAGKIGSAKSSGYSASKHAVLGFTNSLRQELVGTGVHITTVNPGPVNTPFFDRADPTGNYVKNVKWFMLQPEQVGEAVLKGISRRKVEIDIPWTASAGVKLYQMFPRLLDRLAYKIFNKK